MAIYKIFPTQDTTLYSSSPNMNTGLDAICEISNTLEITGNPGVSRFLIQFDQTEIHDIISSLNGIKWTVYLNNFISTAQGINTDTTIEISPIAQQWNNGTGHYLDSPQTKDGASWNFSDYSGSNPWSLSGNINGNDYTSSYNPTYSDPGGGNWFINPELQVNKTFNLREVKDLNVDVYNIVNIWYKEGIPNYGFILKLTDPFEFSPNQNIQPILKYYSVDTNTIYPPTLEFRIDDYSTIIDENFTGSIVSTTNLKLSLDENPGIFYPESVNKFYINVSPLYPARTYQTSSLYTNLNYLPTSSYYAVKDLDTNEFVINFDETYTKISSDVNGNYFTLYMSGLEPERYYKILIKTIINGSTLIFDDNYYFKVING